MEKPYDEQGYVSEQYERITASSPAVGIGYKAARFTARTVLYSAMFAAAAYLGLSVTHVPIEVRVGSVTINNSKAISCIDSLFGKNDLPKNREPSTAGPGINY